MGAHQWVALDPIRVIASGSGTSGGRVPRALGSSASGGKRLCASVGGAHRTGGGQPFVRQCDPDTLSESSFDPPRSKPAAGADSDVSGGARLHAAGIDSDVGGGARLRAAGIDSDVGARARCAAGAGRAGRSSESGSLGCTSRLAAPTWPSSPRSPPTLDARTGARGRLRPSPATALRGQKTGPVGDATPVVSATP